TMFSYGGTILRVDMTSGRVRKEPVSEKLASDYIGGRGFTAKILYDELRAGTDPLGPDNKLVMASGPLAGLFLPAGGKTTFAAKSPATGLYGDSNIGGLIAAEIKYAGYDAVVIEGKSPRPVFLIIEDDKVELRDASKYWGKGSMTAEKMLKDDLGEDFQICIIGPAGENLVKYACISHDFGRQAGRTGLGAVMGSKNLKAIAVRGTGSIRVADPDGLLKLGKQIFKQCFSHPAMKLWQQQGTASVVTWANEIGAFPTRNFQSGQFKDYLNISGEKLVAETLVRSKACFGCPMACGKYSKTRKGDKDVYVEGPEYETSALIGGNFAIGNIHDLTYANYICDELGIDTISGGNVAGFAAECFEKGMITKEQTGGFEIKFGSIDSFVGLMELIAYRRGIGDILAEGVKSAAGKFGKGSEKIGMQVKGLEISGYESRRAPAMLLAYMTCDIGAHHNRAWAITHDIQKGRDVYEGKAQRVIELQHIRPMFDMLAACRLQWVELEIALESYAELFRVCTGMKHTLADLLKASERVWNLNRLFALREIKEFGREFDYPPARVFEEGVTNGPTKGAQVTKAQIDQMLDEYYYLRGWDKKGRPTSRKLTELGLEVPLSLKPTVYIEPPKPAMRKAKPKTAARPKARAKPRLKPATKTSGKAKTKPKAKPRLRPK
ncbi:MAG: aldehyde ferredoxin oxidoreductase family protein, partial [Planctomycetota bacterium]|nr:aldehyde ferredoxin oxidoreductase family protein [Planctomycetota bacterium]